MLGERTIPGLIEFFREQAEYYNRLRIMYAFIRKARPKRKVRGWKNKEKRRIIGEQIKSKSR